MSTVVAQPHSTAGNGGRKLVSLSNGWEVAVTKTTGQFTFYVDKKDGNGWKQLCYMNSPSIKNGDIALASHGTRLYTIQTSDITTIRSYNFDVLTVPNTNIDSIGTYGLFNVDKSQTDLGGVTLTINPQGTELHAVWASKNSSYPNSFNIRYAKGTINADGSVTWGAVEQLTKRNAFGQQVTGLSIALKDGNPLIVFSAQNFGAQSEGSTWDAAISGERILSLKKDGTVWKYYTIYEGGSYIQSNPSAAVDKDGVIHVAWNGNGTLKYAKSTNGGVSWNVVEVRSGYSTGLIPSITVDRTGKLFIMMTTGGANEGNADYSYSTDGGGSWTSLSWANTASYANPSTLYDPTFEGRFGIRPPTIYQDVTKGVVIYEGSYTTNQEPTITLNTTTNRTLYENDMLTIDGSAIDTDADQSVTVYYQINAEAKKVLATNLSQTQIVFNKQLTFKNGKLYDGDVAISGTLTDGVSHTLKVWSQDSEGAESTVQTRTFYVVPNRAPSLTIDAVVPSGNINSDKFTISGSAGDPDANANVKVTYRINVNNSVEVYNGPGGAFTFEVALGQLVVGQNTIVVEAVDNYGAKYSRTIKLNKNEVKTPLLKSTARYKIEPPSGSAKGVLLWTQRSENLHIDAKISMTLAGEPENFVAMSLEGTAPVSTGIVEDEFFYETLEAKDNIVLELELTRTSTEVNDTITLISGVLE